MTNEQLVLRIKAGDNIAQNMEQLWLQTEKFIRTIVQRYNGLEETDDLIQEGYLGLQEAVDRFNIDKGVKFLTYAGYWVDNRVRRYINNMRLVRVPRYMHEDIFKYNKFISDMEKKLGRAPTDTEISRYLCKGTDKIHEIKTVAERCKIESLDKPLDNINSNSIGDMIADSSDMETDIISSMDNDRLKEILWSMVDELGEKPAEIIRKKYIECKTYKEIGQLLGYTLYKVRDMESKALKEMRSTKKRKILAPYIDDYIYNKAIKGGGVRTFERTWTSSTEHAALSLIGSFS